MMRTARSPGSIEADDHREEHIFYVDRVDMERRNEIAEAIEFDGAGPLFPRAAALIPRLARLEIDDVQSKADLRQLLAGFALEACDISPDVPQWSELPRRGDS